MYIIIPVIIITLLAAISFGANNFRNLDISDSDFIPAIKSPFPKEEQQEKPDNKSQPILQEP